MENPKPYKVFFAYFITIVGTIANLVVWTDSRTGPLWISLLATMESLALLNIWIGRFISKTFWEKSLRPSFWLVLGFLLLRLMALPLTVAP